MKLMKGTLALAIAAIGFGGASVATAGDIVDTWSYEVSAAWTSATATDPGAGPAEGFTQNADTISWGDSDENPGNGFGDQSKLVITNSPVTNPGGVPELKTYTLDGGMIPATSFVEAINLRHDNFPVYGPWLSNAKLTTTLKLSALTPAVGPELALDSLSYEIGFAETSNSILPCTVTSPVPCNDIFATINPPLDQTFQYDDVTYFVNILPVLTGGDDFGMLSPAACTAAGAGAGCFGFTTVERQSNNLQFRFAVSTRPLNDVPEPALLALMGIGFAGAAAARRRKKA